MHSPRRSALILAAFRSLDAGVLEFQDDVTGIRFHHHVKCRAYRKAEVIDIVGDVERRNDALVQVIEDQPFAGVVYRVAHVVVAF